MCVKIIKSEKSLEFNKKQPLEDQIQGAKAIVINYNPEDPTISNVESLFDQMDRLYKTGSTLDLDIRFNANNHLQGIRLERRLEKLKSCFYTNDFIKKLTKFHAEADEKLRELSRELQGQIDEH